MNIFEFSKSEIERLYQIKGILDNEVDNLEYEAIKVFPEIPIEEFRKIPMHLDSSMQRYYERLDTYKYQIFVLITENDWEQRLKEWKRNICLDNIFPHRYYIHLSSLSTWVNGIIPGTSRPVPDRIRLALYQTHGYEK